MKALVKCKKYKGKEEKENNKGKKYKGKEEKKNNKGKKYNHFVNFRIVVQYKKF